MRACPPPHPLTPHSQVAAYYLAPPLLRGAVDLLRGYAGELTPSSALSAIESEVWAHAAGWLAPAPLAPWAWLLRRGRSQHAALACRRGLTLCLHVHCGTVLLLLPLQGNAVIVDIRTAREKESAGCPDIPNPSEA